MSSCWKVKKKLSENENVLKEKKIKNKKKINLFGEEDTSEITLKFIKSILNKEKEKNKIIDIIKKKIYIENEKNKNIKEYNNSYYKVLIEEKKWLLKRKEEVKKQRLKKIVSLLIKIVKENEKEFKMKELIKIFDGII